jgi:hypothetical protein
VREGFELPPQTVEEQDRRRSELEALEESREFDVWLEDRAAEKNDAPTWWRR